MKPEINVLWFKRDLRLFDNESLLGVLKENLPVLPVYIFEPSLYHDEHYSERHWRFVYQSLLDINQEFKGFNASLHIAFEEVKTFFEVLLKSYDVKGVYSIQEIGLNITYERDKNLVRFFDQENINWFEYRNGGVLRGLSNRDDWRKQWYGYMQTPIEIADLNKIEFVDYNIPEQFALPPKILTLSAHDNNFQKGGRNEGLKWAESFFCERLKLYSDYISKPENSRYGCSRLSPYFAWGCLSVREIYQRCVVLKKTSAHKKQLTAFMSRLRWQAHFIQKFEMESRIEFEAFNKGYLSLEQPINIAYVNAWKTGTTGFPLVDASLRAVVTTGYLNFRMRTMSTSFLVHLLFQHFTTGSAWLAQQFLDFEPGIHYAQFQMQAGFTATNTIRIYNPTKNALDHDSEAIFIKKWVPELSNLPAELAIQPWNITEMEEKLYNFSYGKDYPERIIDYTERRKFALKELYAKRKDDLTKKEKQRILDVHTLKRRFL